MSVDASSGQAAVVVVVVVVLLLSQSGGGGGGGVWAEKQLLVRHVRRTQGATQLDRWGTTCRKTD